MPENVTANLGLADLADLNVMGTHTTADGCRLDHVCRVRPAAGVQDFRAFYLRPVVLANRSPPRRSRRELAGEDRLSTKRFLAMFALGLLSPGINAWAREKRENQLVTMLTAWAPRPVWS